MQHVVLSHIRTRHSILGGGGGERMNGTMRTCRPFQLHACPCSGSLTGLVPPFPHGLYAYAAITWAHLPMYHPNMRTRISTWIPSACLVWNSLDRLQPSRVVIVHACKSVLPYMSHRCPTDLWRMHGMDDTRAWRMENMHASEELYESLRCCGGACRTKGASSIMHEYLWQIIRSNRVSP